MIISFAWTVDALLDGTKTVTRRFWKSNTAWTLQRIWGRRDVVDAYDKSPRCGGKKVATIRLTHEPYQERVEDISDEHFEREGGTRYWKDKQEFIDEMKKHGDTCWVIEFELVGKDN